MSLLSQPDLRYWIVFDEEIFASAPPGVGGFSREEMRDAFDAHSWFTKADTLPELAAKAGIDAAGLLRRDLYSAFAVVVLRVPPLRERKGDIVGRTLQLRPAVMAGHARPSQTIPGNNASLACTVHSRSAVRAVRGSSRPDCVFSDQAQA